RRGVAALEPARRVEPWILRERPVQQRRSRTRQADDDDRRADLLGEDLGMRSELLLGTEAIHQEVHDAAALRRAPEIEEPGFPVEGGQQHLERRAERLVTEIVETRFGARLREDRLLVQGR